MINGAGFVSLLLLLLIPLNFFISKKILNRKILFLNIILFFNLFFTVYFLLFTFYCLDIVIGMDYNIIQDFYLKHNLVIILISGVGQLSIMHIIFKILFKEEYSKNFTIFLMLYSAPVTLIIIIKIFIDYV